MKLEFLDNISENGKWKDVVCSQLLRLFDFDQSETKKLINEIKQVIIENKQSLEFSKLDFIQSLNCQLVLKLAETSTGISSNDMTNFTCKLTIDDYQNMIQLIEPFYSNGLNGFQWLYDSDNSIEFLFSPGGTW